MSSNPKTVFENSRTAVLSARNLESHPARSHGYEFEDVIVQDLEAADLFAPERRRYLKWAGRVKNRLSRRFSASRFIPSGLRSMVMPHDYDLFFFSAAHLSDLNLLSAIPGWRARSQHAVAWLQELWIDGLDRQRALLERLNEFDLVVCSFADTTEVLQQRLRVPVVYMPWAVDMRMFCPYPNPPRRAIDVLNIGFRNPVTHKALIDYADRTGQFYLYETLTGRANMKDYRAHRRNYVGQLQRSRFFFSFLAKAMRTEERGEQCEFGLRYLEGAAAGTVILGARLESDAFQEHLGWEDSVIEVPVECANIDEILEDLNAQDARIAEISRRNVTECLKRHDHLHRWEQVLKLIGMQPHAKLTERKKILDDLSKNLEQTGP